MTTLLALYRRPDGGPDALAEFERRYAAEHLPLVAGTPGLRSTRVQRVAQALGGETDLVFVTAMTFDDRAGLDAGLASDAMRAAGRSGSRSTAPVRCSSRTTPTCPCPTRGPGPSGAPQPWRSRSAWSPGRVPPVSGRWSP